jgi:predicted anti-sigma-YlaC factor YlaD
MTPSLDCQTLVELVTDHLEGVLDSPSRQLFEEHLAECEGCEIYVEQMRITLRVLGSIPPQSLDSGPRDSLLQAFRSWSAGRGAGA